MLDLPAANPVMNKIKLAQKPLNPLPIATSGGGMSVGAMRRQGTSMGGGAFKQLGSAGTPSARGRVGSSMAGGPSARFNNASKIGGSAMRQF